MTANHKKKGHPAQLAGDGVTPTNTQIGTAMSEQQQSNASALTPPRDAASTSQVASAESQIDREVTELADQIAERLVTIGRGLGMPHDVIVETALRAVNEVATKMSAPPDPDGLADAVADVSVRLLAPEKTTAELGAPSPVVERALARVKVEGREHLVEIVREELLADQGRA